MKTLDGGHYSCIRMIIYQLFFPQDRAAHSTLAVLGYTINVIGDVCKVSYWNLLLILLDRINFAFNSYADHFE